MNVVYDTKFYQGKKVLITGHTGFKGGWLCKVLTMLGASVTGYALEPPTDPSLFQLLNLEKDICSVSGDIRDLNSVKAVLTKTKPEIVIHMAAQPIVRDSYKNPVYTYETNVMGTVNVLEAIRNCGSVKSVVNVTTDKVYLNKEWTWGYREYEELNGYDPYSNSKSCSELVTSSYKNSFFYDRDIAVSTCRAGNVIGGGDFAIDRIIPDCIRAIEREKQIIVRNPYSTRPYQHVLEPILVYLMLAQAQYDDKTYAGSYNVGPNDGDCLTTGELVTLFCDKWNITNNDSISWINESDEGPHEANFLKLDCSKLKNSLGWSPRWDVNTCMDKIVEWFKIYRENGDVIECTENQIRDFLNISR